MARTALFGAGRRGGRGGGGGRPGSGGRTSRTKSGAGRSGRKPGARTGTRSAASAPVRPTWGAVLLRLLVTLVAFAAMVGFAVLLARLTLTPSAASEHLTHSNLRPGDSIRAYLDQPGLRDAAKQIGGNVLLGVPFGVLLPVLLPRTRGLLRIALLTALVMVLVELVQGLGVTGRAFDIDDVILNTFGALLGYFVVGRRLGRAVHPRRRAGWRRSRTESAAGD
ncbi:hypothetical protein CRI70_17440 [Streptomyces sp. Ru87]|nr:hypothetical protein CRI70_17440 [Streptomyces sp. Ru87]